MATQPPIAPEIIIEIPPKPQTTLELETQTPPPLQSSNPPFHFSVPSHPTFPVAVVSAPQSPLHAQPLLAFSAPPVVMLPSTESLASAPLSFGVIQAYYRRVRRFIGMEVVRALVGFGVGVLVTYLWMKNKK